jgi:hypothetical protein
MDKQGRIVAMCIIALVILIPLGFFVTPSEAHVLTRIETENVKYWEANYSEYTYDVIEGDWYTEYWEEMASEVYSINTVYSELYGYEFYNKYPQDIPDALEAPTPNKWAMPTKHLDHIVLRNRTDIKCWYDTDDGQEDFNRISMNEYSKYKKMIGDTVMVGTWFGIRTGMR